ncbi:MAG: Asp-tRNA(Asn)/Glu-tRNA(Gln) amidotransferase subunit GatB [Candidatus Daviesbacteria bacterium]|nr:Asp-tRNA(Asn)/Glu-tRNA(Gln) amidotransferase subunit GatB [Candidatus Daviesbacteria bacterium]
MNKYETVIGLEVHVELNTKSKMFCRCSVDYFGAKPNTHTCPVCLGLPGALPYINKQAIEDCMEIGLALNCEISNLSRFERKNYFYPDLAKGYQISQYRWPLCINGWLEVENEKGEKVVIRINRAHQEEDTGKLTHSNGETLIDYNRSSVPLVEVVTEPDFRDTAEVRDYAKKLQQLFRYLGVSNADMERGDMRLEANVSVRLEGTKELPSYRVELKNINSFRFMVAAIEYEVKRQIEALEKGEKLVQETRGWDENKKQTFVQRVKEEANDYRYFPDPDLPVLEFTSAEVGQMKNDLPELPWEKLERFVEDYEISLNNAKILTEERISADLFEEAIKQGLEKQIKPQQIANFIVNQKIKLDSEEDIASILESIANKKVDMIEDESELIRLVQEAITENKDSADAYKSGKLGALNVILGSVMKKSNGKVNADKIRQLLEDNLK